MKFVLLNRQSVIATQIVLKDKRAKTESACLVRVVLSAVQDKYVKEELVLIYQLLYKKQGVKSFASKNYWSSSKNKSDFAWIFDFYSGDTYDYYNRYNAYFVRAVREF